MVWLLVLTRYARYFCACRCDQLDRLQQMVKENYVLKHDLDDLDEKIRMLIKNKLSLEEVTTSVSHLLGDQQEQVRRLSTARNGHWWPLNLL